MPRPPAECGTRVCHAVDSAEPSDREAEGLLRLAPVGVVRPGERPATEGSEVGFDRVEVTRIGGGRDEGNVELSGLGHGRWWGRRREVVLD